VVESSEPVVAGYYETKNLLSAIFDFVELGHHLKLHSKATCRTPGTRLGVAAVEIGV
jgi:hypothetical protein